MKTEINRCMGCMSEKLYAGPCEICGYIDNDAYPAGCLAPRTLVAERYVIGKLMAKGGEGFSYLAYDLTEDHPVEIKEFMPDTLCRRAADGETVEITEGCLPLYKSYLSEFADLQKMLMADMPGAHLKRTLGIFAANGTGYVVTEHLKGATLEEYLPAHGGKLTWESAAPLFAPLLDTLSAINSRGIVHRGLSPETVFVTVDERLIPVAIDISAARTAGSQITCDMTPGYTASEQYALSERQGSWTDVYGISAVLYRVLTGTVPPDTQARRIEDHLAAPADINDEIPKYVSDAITDGLAVNQADRIHTVAALKERLYNPPAEALAAQSGEIGADGPVTPKVSVKLEPERRPAELKRGGATPEQMRKKKKKKKKDKKKAANIGTATGLIIFFVLVAALIIAIAYFSDEAQRISDGTVTARTTESSPEPDDETPDTTTTTAVPAVTSSVTTTGDMIVLPNFVDRFFNKSLESRYSMLIFEAEYEYSDTYSEGIIMEQDIAEGTPVSGGTTIKIKVSRGAAYTLLPDYVGMKFNDYTAKLQQLGVRFTAEAEETNEVKAGYVVRCSKEIGDKVYISENESIIVYYAVAPKVTEPPETEPVEEEIPIDDNYDDDDEIEEIIEEDE